MQSGLKLFFSSTIFYPIKQTPISYNDRLEHINYATHQKEKEKKTLTKEIFMPAATKLKGQENYQLRDLQEKRTHSSAYKHDRNQLGVGGVIFSGVTGLQPF